MISAYKGVEAATIARLRWLKEIKEMLSPPPLIGPSLHLEGKMHVVCSKLASHWGFFVCGLLNAEFLLAGGLSEEQQLPVQAHRSDTEQLGK